MPFVIESGSKQYTVARGQQFVVDRLSAEVGDVVNYTVLFSYGSDKEAITTLPAKVVTHQKGKKIRVVKYKSKSNYHKQMGYRHFETVLEIEGGVAKAKSVKPAKAAKEKVETVAEVKEEKAPKTTKAKTVKAETKPKDAPKKTIRKKKTDEVTE